MDNSNHNKIKKKKKKHKKKSISSSFSLMFGKERLTKEQERFKRYKESLKLIENKNTRANVVYIYELSKFNLQEINLKFNSMKEEFEKKKLNNFLTFYNRIREVINSRDPELINKFVYSTDKQLYNIKENIDENSNNEGKKIKLLPIKNFWKNSLINCRFFYINKKDAIIMNYIRDIIFIPLDYPNFRLEFHFRKNECIKQKMIYKEYYYNNINKEKLIKSFGFDIDWQEDAINPTLKLVKKDKKDKKNKKGDKKNKNKKENLPNEEEDEVYEDCKSFFNIFNIDKSTSEKDFIEANFFSEDFLPNILEYYLNIFEIQYENEEDELLSNN